MMHIAQCTPMICTPLPFCRLLWSLSIPLFHMQLHYAACGMQHGWYYENLFLKLLDICLILPTMYFAVDERFCVKLWEFTLRSNDAPTTLEVICATTPTNNFRKKNTMETLSSKSQNSIQDVIMALFLLFRDSTPVNGTPTMHWYSIYRCCHSCATKTHSIDGIVDVTSEFSCIMDDASTVWMKVKIDVSWTPCNIFKHNPFHSGYMCTRAVESDFRKSNKSRILKSF